MPGIPWTRHTPATPFAPDAQLLLDAGMADAIAHWFAIGQDASLALAAKLAAEHAPAPQVFPEHFDLGIAAGAVNYGF